MILPENILQDIVFLSKDRKLAVIAKDKYFDLAGLSQYGGLGVATLRKHIRKNKLPHFQVDGKILVKQSEYDKWIEGYRKHTDQDVKKVVDEVVQKVK